MSSSREPSDSSGAQAPENSADSNNKVTPINVQPSASPEDDMKRVAAKQLIERYYYQLVDGCGREYCDNENCASSGKGKKLTGNEAAVLALQLFKDKAKLCEPNAPKVAKTSTSPCSGTSCVESAATSKETVSFSVDKPSTSATEKE
ncbi:ubiquitin-protein ligase E3A-like, partial [Saccoglossus kowalevskii]|uniref:Ubiquitin-protein ligase E3A-like n=1 Tax=Saccoglossus kowalevskii TaxID=10224 RepID=A0ABM0MFZ2_SACKO